MFNKLKTTTLAVAAAAVLAAPALALPDQPNLNGAVGSCTVRFLSEQAGNNNGVFLTIGGFNTPGGSAYDLGNGTAKSGTGNPIDVPLLQNTCGLGGVDDLVIYPAVDTPGVQDDYDAATYYGVTFQAVDIDGVLKAFEIAATNSGFVIKINAVPVTPPTVTLSSTTATLTGTAPFTVTATFDEDVTGFDDLVNDVTVTNGTVTAITGGPSVYTLTVTPTGTGDVEITVPAAAAQDAASNDNTASNTLVIGNQIVEITQEQIAGFMLTRANNLASNQPGLTRFLMGEGCGNFNLSATNGSGSVSGCVTRGNTWAEITSAWSGDGSYTLGTLGAHASLNPNLLVGGMVQFDYADDPANNASGKGYMVGPYFVAKLPEHPLYFEGRLLYGQTDNEISPLGTYTDSFETERWLAQLRATGEYKLRNTTLMPLLDVTYTEDNQRAYTDSLGNTIPSQAVDLMQVSAGLDFSTPIPVQMGNLELTGGIKGIYSSTNGGTAAPEFENWRGRTTLGLNYDTGRGGTLKFGSFYDGLGTNYESYGASLNFDMKF
jgi:hypothetical protein